MNSHQPIEGLVLRLTEPVSFLTIEPRSGAITDQHHPQHGLSIRDRILMLPGTRGGSATPSQFCEMLRLGTAPKAILMPEWDNPLCVGAWVAEFLYQKTIPMFLIDRLDYACTCSGDCVRILAASANTTAD